MKIGKLKKAGITLLSLFMIVGLFTSNVKTIDAVENNDTSTTKSVEEENNIKINLFDYSTGNSEQVWRSYNYHYGWQTSASYNAGINQNHTFKFTNSSDNMENDYNKYTGQINTGGGYPRYNIVQNTLDSNGYPILSDGSGSLDYLFNQTSVTGKTSYQNVTGLLTKKGSNYTFDSDSQYAEFDTTSNSFDLSNAINGFYCNNEFKNQNLGVFYPFNSKSDIESISGQWNSKVTAYSVGYGFDADTTINQSTKVNHYFGMTMETDFLQPKNGKTNDNKDMIFEFSGDDDVWVFIDNKLTLDLGGIHDKVTGTINFATGDVIIKRNDGTVDKDHSFNMFSGYTFNNEYNSNYKLFDKDEDFDDYTSHSLKFFYLERGNNASNCKLDFNLITIPAGSVVVSKEVTNTEGIAVNYSDTDYEFQILKEEENEMKALSNASYEIYKNGLKTGEGTTDENGIFTLKHEETAIFANSFLDNDNYQVTETGAYLNGYDISSSIVTSHTIDESGVFEAGVTTGSLSVSENPSVKFSNKIEKTSTLTITKTIDDKSEALLSDKSFTLNLKINGKTYAGSYQLNGDSKTTDNGNIALSKNDIITITGLPYGTSFEVVEEKNEEYNPTYNVDGGVYDSTYSEKAYGKVNGNNAYVNIENAINTDRKTQVNVTKQWNDGNNNERPDNIQVQLYKNGDAEGDSVAIAPNNGEWNYTFENLPYYSYDNETNQYIENNYTVNEVNVDEKYISEVSNDGNNWTITNTLKTSLTITKHIKSNDDDNDNGDSIFTFKITNVNDESEYYYKTIRLENGQKQGSVEIDGLKYNSIYRIEELDVIRYQVCDESGNLISDTSQEIVLTNDSNNIYFYNKKIYDKNFSDANVIINKFTVNEDGTISINADTLKENAESEVE